LSAAARRASAEDHHQQNPITPRYPAGRVRTSNLTVQQKESGFGQTLQQHALQQQALQQQALQQQKLHQQAP
jgi:hypothetical protein